MNDDAISKLLSFNTEIKNDGTIEYPIEKFKKLSEQGFEKIKICVYGDSKNVALQIGINAELFEKIKSIQSLPDLVVLDFLKSKGSLTNSNFKERILF